MGGRWAGSVLVLRTLFERLRVGSRKADGWEERDVRELNRILELVGKASKSKLLTKEVKRFLGNNNLEALFRRGRHVGERRVKVVRL